MMMYRGAEEYPFLEQLEACDLDYDGESFDYEDASYYHEDKLLFDQHCDQAYRTAERKTSGITTLPSAC